MAVEVPVSILTIPQEGSANQLLEQPPDHSETTDPAPKISPAALYYYQSAGFSPDKARELAIASTPQHLPDDQQRVADTLAKFWQPNIGPHTGPTYLRFLPEDQRFVVRDIRRPHDPEKKDGLEIWLADIRLDPSPLEAFNRVDLPADVRLVGSNIRHGTETVVTVNGPKTSLRIATADFINAQAKPELNESNQPTINLKKELFALLGPHE